MRGRDNFTSSTPTKNLFFVDTTLYERASFQRMKPRGNCAHAYFFGSEIEAVVVNLEILFQ